MGELAASLQQLWHPSKYPVGYSVPLQFTHGQLQLLLFHNIQVWGRITLNSPALGHQACNVSRCHAKGFGQYRNKRRKNAKAKGILTTKVSAGTIRWACPRNCTAIRSECSQRHHEDYEVTGEERSLRLSTQFRPLECKEQCTKVSGAKSRGTARLPRSWKKEMANIKH